MTVRQLVEALNRLPPELLDAKVDVATFDGRYQATALNGYLAGLVGDQAGVVVLGDPIIFAGYGSDPDVSWEWLEVKN